MSDLAHARMFIPHPAFPQFPLASALFFFYASHMFGKPRQLETESQLYDAAIKILMRRAHSVSEMKKALLRRCEHEELVKSVVERLKQENLIDDARYARQFTRHRAEAQGRIEHRWLHATGGADGNLYGRQQFWEQLHELGHIGATIAAGARRMIDRPAARARSGAEL